MRIIIIISLIAFTSLASCIHPAVGQTLTFTDIGWTINLPEGFDLLDSSAIDSSIVRGKKLVGKSNGVNFDSSKSKLLIIAKKGNTTFMSSVTPYTEDDQDIWLSADNHTKESLFHTMMKNMSSAQFDSLTSIEIIDSLVFRKFKITARINGKVVYNATVLSKFYKGYDFKITYVIGDEKVGLELEEMLRDSHFAK